MSSLFKSAWLKIDRAKHHIRELSTLIGVFQSEHPYEIVIQADLKPGYQVHKLRLTNPDMLGDFGLLVGDGLNNMRAALDHAVYACAIANGHAIPKFRTCNFPFGNNATSFDNAVNGCTAVSQNIRTMLRTFQAHKDGNIHLWALNNMCNLEKHALVTPVVVGWDTLHILVTNDAAIESPANPFWNDTKTEIELFITRDDPQYEFNISLDIALHAPKANGPNRADGLLNGFLWDVERAVSSLEAEIR